MNRKNRFVSRLAVIASLDLTVILLMLLSVLVVWGTLYQVSNGIYAAQERFFKAWFTTIGGIIPFPAVKSIVLLLAVNLAAQLFQKRRLTVKTAGIFIIHFGVMVLVAGSAVASRLVKEATVTLQKEQSTSEAYDFSSWRLEIMERDSKGTHQTSLPFTSLKKGKSISLKAAPATIVIDKIYPNCSAMIDRQDHVTVQELRERPPEKERGHDVPGATLHLATEGNGDLSAHLYAAIEHPEVFSVNNTTVAVSLAPHRFTLPVKVQLRNFDVQWHPGTMKAKSYRSTLRVLGKNIDREVAVEMNRPFRFGSYTFYQMSYTGTEGHYSTSLAVVYNPLRYMPYIASIIVVAGLLLHFLVKLTSTLSSSRGTHRD